MIKRSKQKYLLLVTHQYECKTESENKQRIEKLSFLNI